MKYEKMIDMNQSLNIKVFDQLVFDFYHCKGNQNKLNEILIKFSEHPKAWMQSSQIIMKSNEINSKIIALKALQKCVQTKWKVLPKNEKTGIRRFLEQNIIEISKNIGQGKQELKPLLIKMNTTLIEVVKHEWPHNWLDFLPSIINYARMNQMVCINVVNLLRIFSEEIFNNSQTLIKYRAKILQDALQQNTGDIFSFFLRILRNSENILLLQETLKALINYIQFIPSQFVFESQLIEMLTIKFFPTEFQIKSLECMCEIVSLPITKKNLSIENKEKIKKYRKKMFKMFSQVVETYKSHITTGKSVVKLMKDSTHEGETFIRLFIALSCSYLKSNLEFLENNFEPQIIIITAINLLIETMQVKEEEILVILTQFWFWWVNSVDEKHKCFTKEQIFFETKINKQKKSPYFEHYVVSLVEANVMNMVRPKEVLVVRDAFQNVIENEVKQSIRLQIYKNISETLQKLCSIELEKTLNSISGILNAHFGGMKQQSIFNDWPILNSVCWSIGSISNCIPEQQSKHFLVQTIQALLYLCERTPEKQDKAIVAANIMYVVRKNPRFLQRYWKLLQTIISKVFEFMQERFPGVQEMATETFEEIARRCRSAFDSKNQIESITFLEKLLLDLPRIVGYLPPKLIHQVWKGLGWIIRAEKDETLATQLLVSVMTIPNMIWNRTIENFKNNPERALKDQLLCRNFINVLKTNTSLAEILMHKYYLQLGKLMEEIVLIYKILSHAIEQYGIKNGINTMNHDICLIWRNILNSILELFTTCVEVNCLEKFQVISGTLEYILMWFGKVPTTARDPQVINFCTAIIKQQKTCIEPILSNLLLAIVEPTREMIKNNEEFPDHRRSFFIFIKELIKNCFSCLLKLPGEQFDQILNVLIWSYKHLDQQMAEIGLEAVLILLKKIPSSQIANDFYTNYLPLILTTILEVMTDTMHKAGFPLHVKILNFIVNLIDSGNITIQLWTQNQRYNNNRDCVKDSIIKLCQQTFPNLQQKTINNFSDNIFLNCQNKNNFETCLKDFLVQTKETQL